MRISFVIVTWNCLKQIRECLRTLVLLNIPNSEIIVVDANSHDGTAEFLQSFPNIRLHRMFYKDSWCVNNDIGISLAKGDWICVMNPDIYFDKGFFHLIEELTYVSTYTIMAPQLIFPNGSKQLPFMNLDFGYIAFVFNPVGRILDRVVARNFFGRSRHPTIREKGLWKVEHPIGSMFLVSRNTIDMFGGQLWHNGFTLMAADSDMFRKAKEMGVDIFIDSDTKVVHEQAHSTKTRPRTEIEYELAYGFVLFARYWREHPMILSLFFFLDSVLPPLAALIRSQLRVLSGKKKKNHPRMKAKDFMARSASRLSGVIDAWSVKID